MSSEPAVFSSKGSGVAPSDFATLLQFSRRLSGLEAGAPAAFAAPVSDPYLDRWTLNNRPYDTGSVTRGTIILSLPFLHCYLVKTGDRELPMLATAGVQSSTLPIGVRDGETLRVGSSVLLWKARNSYLGYIISVLPGPVLYIPDYIQQGSRSSIKKDPGYRAIVNAATTSIGAVPQTCGRPIDGRQGDYSKFAETGVGLFIDSFQAFLRVNELCGLWLNYFGNYAKLSAADLDILSYAQHTSSRFDDGELAHFVGHLIYPHEAVGSYDAASTPFRDNDTEKVQLDADYAQAEVEPVFVDQASIYRIQEYSGYLGHGLRRFVVKPGRSTGNRRVSDAEPYPDTGLFHEALTLDGEYGLRSAKGITFSKYPVIPVPTRKRDVGDPKGDSLSAPVVEDEYRYAFNGIRDGEIVHFAKEWKASPSGRFDNLKRVAGDIDWSTRFFNWKTVFPFSYHEKDFKLPEEGHDTQLNRVEYLTGRYQQSFVAPTPVELDIDERYGRTQYYKLASHLQLTDDGGIIISDGYGSRIVMSGGQIQLESAGDVILVSASRVVSMAKDVVLRAESNVDISAANKDVRIKAEKNFQLLAGNSGVGGILLESKGIGVGQDYEGKIGDEVNASGITLLSKGGGVNLVSREVYLRSGVDVDNAEAVGSIVLDSANGRSDLFMYARQHNIFAQSGVAMWHGLSGQEAGIPSGLHYFSKDVTVLAGVVTAEKDIFSRNGSIWASGSILAGGSIQTAGSMACRNGVLGIGDTSSSNLNGQIDEVMRTQEDQNQQNVLAGNTTVQSLAFAYYSPGRIGFSDLLSNQIGFSFRDTSDRGSGQGTYGYSPNGFNFLETRWQQLSRLGATPDSREPWKEPTVLYQGQQQQPWPGRLNWANTDNPTFLAYTGDATDPDKLGLFDSAAGIAKPRNNDKTVYENPELLDWLESYTCEDHFTL